MAYNWQNMLSGVGLYLLAVGLLYGRVEIFPKALEKTGRVQHVLQAEKRDPDKKTYDFDYTEALKDSKA